MPARTTRRAGFRIARDVCRHLRYATHDNAMCEHAVAPTRAGPVSAREAEPNNPADRSSHTSSRPRTHADMYTAHTATHYCVRVSPPPVLRASEAGRRARRPIGADSLQGRIYDRGGHSCDTQLCIDTDDRSLAGTFGRVPTNRTPCAPSRRHECGAGGEAGRARSVGWLAAGGGEGRGGAGMRVAGKMGETSAGGSENRRSAVSESESRALGGFGPEEAGGGGGDGH